MCSLHLISLKSFLPKTKKRESSTFMVHSNCLDSNYVYSNLILSLSKKKTGIAHNVLALPPLVISHIHHVTDGVSKTMFLRFHGSESSFRQGKNLVVPLHGATDVTSPTRNASASWS
jgi:hypothetical protein